MPPRRFLPGFSILAAYVGAVVVSFAAEPTPTPRPPLTICVDPGHSKATVGARGAKLAEYHVCWQMAVELQRLLGREGMKVVLTKRTEDEDVATRERSEVANRAHADLFLRLHCDAADDSGIATYYPDRAGAAEGASGPSAEVIEASKRLAERFHAAMIRSLGGALRDRGLRTDRVTAVGERQGALTGSVFARVPVLLVEMGVITNPKDEAFLASPEGRDKLARAMAEGVRAALGAPAPKSPGVPKP